jgi:CBS domain-containing protein
MIPAPQEFLAGIQPFSGLPRQTLGEAAGAAVVRHLLERESLESGDGDEVLVLRSGAVELSHAGQVVDLLGPGDCLGFEALLGEEGALPGLRAVAVEDAVFLVLPGEIFREFLTDAAFAAHFSRRLARLRQAVEAQSRAAPAGSDSFLRLAVRDIPLAPPLFVAPGAPLSEAARSMSQARVPACLVGDGERALGILSERDVLDAAAEEGGAALARPVEERMTRNLVTVRGQELLFEAFSRMVDKGIRRLVLVDAEGRALGILGERDLLSARGENPLSLTREARTAGSLEALGLTFARLRGLALRTIAEGIPADNLGRLISEIHDAILTRAAALVAEQSGGPPPPLALAVLGSEGRREQFLATDQDNCMLLPDGLDAGGEAACADFAARLVRALAQIGFPPCPSKVMADNPDWRMSLSAWMNEIDDMILAADARAVLRLSLLADLRHALGEPGHTARLRAYLLRRMAQAPVLLKYMAREALRFTPPLGFFNTLMVDKSGPSKGCLDIKKGGVFPVTQGARTLALELGLEPTSTCARLAAVGEAGVLSREFAEGLSQAFSFLQTLRAQAQAEAVRQGREPDNLLKPERLSGLDRDRLKDCLKIVLEFQSLLHSRYGLRLMS